VPDFDLIRPVGRGGFGEVWLATNRTTGQLRAVKIIPLRQPGQADPAAREIASLTRLEANLGRQHANLLSIHHVGKTANYLFYVMDPADDVAGGPASNQPDYRPATLQSRLQAGPLAAEVCLDYAGQLLTGLASLHAAGMVHRDVKPANCLFVDGQLKLADFGLVTEVHPLVSRLGTQKYMPPDGRMDMRADVYAAGLVIYEMLSGLPVDEFPRLGRQANGVRNSPILATLLRLVLHACEHEPARRPADARAMLAELAVLRLVARRFSRRPLLAATCAAVVCAAGAWAAFFAPRHENLCDVTFVTEPYEAKIYLDGVVQCDPEGNAYTTPCTVRNLRARTCRVAFEWAGLPRWDAGSYDLARTQQIVARRPH
jgi:serine/threonine protein kinase